MAQQHDDNSWFGSKQRFLEAEYQGYDYLEVQGKWRQTREWYEQSADAPSPSLLELSNHFQHFDYADEHRGNGFAGRRRA